MAHRPSKYPWSSYHFNALSKKDESISPHPVYQALASNSEPAHAIYNETIINTEQTVIDREISESLSKNWSVDEPGFIEMVSSQLGGIGYKKRGRPVKGGDQN